LRAARRERIADDGGIAFYLTLNILRFADDTTSPLTISALVQP
jgi:hypothetical protein